MGINENLDYKQILNLIHQLPKKEIERLTITLQAELEPGKTSHSLQKMILDAPTWSEADLQTYNEARNHINQSRIA